MTNPGEPDEWWKQYGGSGISSDPANAQPPAGEPSSYPSAPQYPSTPAAASAPQYPSTPAPVPQYPAAPQYPSTPAPVPQYSSAPNMPPGPAIPGVPPVANPNYGVPPGYGAGYPGSYQPYGYPAGNQGTNGLAIASLISSLVGAITCGIGCVVGIVLGVIALGQIRERGQDGRGMALAGIWTGVGMITFWVLIMILNFGIAFI